MKLLFVTLIILCTHSISAQESNIKTTIQTFFTGLHTRDTIVMQSVAYKNLILESITEYKGQGKLDFETAEEYYKQVANIPDEVKIEERILSYKIQIDGTLAHVWAPYQFYNNGKLSHSGVNSFTLFKEQGIWKIVYIIDTRRAGTK
jgi:hypothetical protein